MDYSRPAFQLKVRSRDFTTKRDCWPWYRTDVLFGQHRQSYELLRLAQAFLSMGELGKARRYGEEALALNEPDTSYQAALKLGIVFLHQYDSASNEAFADAAARCRVMLNKTEGLYEARYALAAALVGQAVCDPCWADVSARANLLVPALDKYRQALAIIAAPGIINDALRDLVLIRDAGVEGLEPAFELLESALAKTDAAVDQ